MEQYEFAYLAFQPVSCAKSTLEKDSLKKQQNQILKDIKKLVK